MNLLSCFCSGPVQESLIDKNSPYYHQITHNLNNSEIKILKLIYEDLAFRDDSKKLTHTNFLLFFNLKGLWGTKLFQKFDEDMLKLISFQEFLYGITRTAKASLQEKIKMLFTFLLDSDKEGIPFRQFIKMLFNYSKDELKEILMQDGVLVQEILVIKPLTEDVQRQLSIIQLNYLDKQKQAGEQTASVYQKAFKNLISQYKDPGTCIQFKKNDQNYRLKYCNMISLVRQFAERIYKKYDIDKKVGRLNYEQFHEWIMDNKKLFYSYYSAFHNDLWQFYGNQPSYLNQNKVEKQFEGKIYSEEKLKLAYFMLVGDAIVIAENKKTMRRPTKIICLEGLNIKEVKDIDGFGIQINHTSDHYEKSTIYFQSPTLRDQWLQHLRIYEGDSLHKRYIIGEVIGTGKFSIVYKCKDRVTGISYALKVIKTANLDKRALYSIKHESQIMKVANHPQIIKYKETIMTRESIYIITELVNGEDLFEYVKKRKFLSEIESAFIIGLIIKTNIYLHSTGIIHRDLKPENIMVVFKKKYANKLTSIADYGQISDHSPIQTIKIIDFGFANHIEQLNKQKQNKMVNGTPHYLCPEVLLGKPYSYKSDIFAIGSILYFLLRGKHTFHTVNQDDVLLKTVKGDYNLTDAHWQNISQEAKALVRGLLEVNPAKRLSLEQAENSEWFNKMPWNNSDDQNNIGISQEDVIIQNPRDFIKSQGQETCSQSQKTTPNYPMLKMERISGKTSHSANDD